MVHLFPQTAHMLRNTDTSSTHCHARSRFPSSSGKSFVFCLKTVRQNTDLSRLTPVEPDQDSVWRRPLQERWPGGEQQPSWHPEKEAWHLGAVLFITTCLPTLTPRLHFCLWFSLLASRLALSRFTLTHGSPLRIEWCGRQNRFPSSRLDKSFRILETAGREQKGRVIKGSSGFFFSSKDHRVCIFQINGCLVLCLTFHGEK